MGRWREKKGVALRKWKEYVFGFGLLVLGCDVRIALSVDLTGRGMGMRHTRGCVLQMDRYMIERKSGIYQ